MRTYHLHRSKTCTCDSLTQLYPCRSAPNRQSSFTSRLSRCSRSSGPAARAGRALDRLFSELLLISSDVIFTCRGILFDLDGVLVDSTGAVARVWRRWAQEHGLPPERVIREAHGRRSIETIVALTPHLDASLENQKVESMEIADQAGVVALPGAARLLRELSGKSFAIVTSATRALAIARLSSAGLPVPQLLVSADDVREGKPSPQPYLQGAAMLGLPTHDCVVFEDTAAGIESAHKAEMRAIALTTTFAASDLAAADAIVASLDEITFSLASGLIRLQTESRNEGH